MHQKYALQFWRDRFHPANQFALIGVPAQFIRDGHFRAHRHRIAKNRYFTLALDDFPPQRVLGLISMS